MYLQKQKKDTKDHGRAKGINLFELILPFKEKLEAFGGHSAAIGLTVPLDYIEEFKKEVEAIELPEIIEKIEYDLSIKFKDLSIELLKTFESLEPFGQENPVPTFLFKNCKVEKKMEYEKVVRLLLSNENQKLFAITFDLEKVKNIKEGDDIHIIAKPNINEFNGNTSIVLNIVDVYYINKDNSK